MSGRRAKRLRKEAIENGTAVKPKQLFYPRMITIKGEEVYIPRRQRRALIRQFLTGVRKGRINLNDRRPQEER